MNPLDAVRHRLQESAATAATAAEALNACAVDLLSPELGRLAGALDGIAGRLADVCDRLSVGIDPQGASGAAQAEADRRG
jgi:hypothetical protein